MWHQWSPCFSYPCIVSVALRHLLLKKMRPRFLNLLAILTLVLIFFSFFRPSVNPALDDPLVNQHTMPGDSKLQNSLPPISAYPCPACDYPPWLVEFLLKWFWIFSVEDKYFWCQNLMLDNLQVFPPLQSDQLDLPRWASSTYGFCHPHRNTLATGEIHTVKPLPKTTTP